MNIVYQHMKQYDKAEQLMMQSLNIDIRSNNKYNQLSSYVSLADLKLLQHKYEEVKQHLDKAIELGKGLDAAHYMDDAYKVYTRLDSMTGDYQSAFRHIQLQYEFKNKVIQDERQKQLDRLETVYSTKENEKEKRVFLISTNQKKYEFEWIISAAFYKAKDVQFHDLKIPCLFFVVFLHMKDL